MKRVPGCVLPGCLWILFVAPVGFAQGPVATTTYYLHKETVTPWTTMPTLRVANPDQGSSTAQSQNYRNVTAPYLDPVIKSFRSVPPSAPGTILAGSTVTFSVYMKKSSSFGTVYPYFKLWTYDNNDPMAGNLIPLCNATGTTALDTSITRYVVSCTISVASPMTPTRAYRMDVGAHVAVSPLMHNLTVSAYFDGITFSGSYPSSIKIPNSVPPAITGLSSSLGNIGSTVTISGAYFGNAQGTNTVTFNGVAAPVISWTNTSIQVSVPETTTGPVVVSVNGAASNSMNFVVMVPTISGISPDAGTVGTPVIVSGSYFGATYDPESMSLLFNGVASTPTFWSDTSIQAPVPQTTSGPGPVVVRVNGVNSNAVNFTVTVPTITGIAPSSGYVGSHATISGSGFGTSYNPASMRVYFNSIVAMPTQWSDTSIRAVVPATTSGPVTVQVNSVVSNSAAFTILPNEVTSGRREYIYFGDRPLAVESGAGSSTGPTGYAFYRPMTINHTLAPETQSNFPVLVAKTNVDLKSVGNGGRVQHLDGGKPADLAFFVDPELSTPLDFEIERYDPETGELLAWVRIPSLSSTVDTVFYLAYGNAAVMTSPQNPASVWDSNYKFVGHLPNGTTLSAVDSSSFGNHGTPVNNPTATSGSVDGAASLNSAATQHISLPANFNHGSAAMTWSAWIKATSLPNAYNAVLVGAGNSEYTRILVRSDGKLALSVRSDFPSIYGDLSYDAGANTLTVGSWYYVAMTAAYTGGNPASHMTGYLNGVFDGADGVLLWITPMTQPVLIGRDPVTTPRDWNGAIDEVRISNVERSAAWILTEYNTLANPDAFVVMGDAMSRF